MAWYIIRDSFRAKMMHKAYNIARHWALHKTHKAEFFAYLYGNFKAEQTVKDFNDAYNMGGEL